jgi:pimeloyl-ACP methyl ester carboxylesterase
MAASVEVLDKFVTLSGLRVHYREWGAPDAAPLLMLHGGASAARGLDAVARALASTLHVVVPDLRGHGESAWAADYALDSFVSDLEQLVDQLALPPFALLGHSLGAVIAYTYAARYPGRVRRLVLGDIGPDEFSVPAVLAVHARVKAAGAEVFDDPDIAISAAIAAAPTMPAEAVRERTAYNLVQGADGRWRWRYDGAGIIATYKGSGSEAEAWATLARVPCPTLVVRGESSPILSRATAERMAETLRDGRWAEVPNCGHGIPLENFAGFMAAVAPFLLDGQG